MWTRIIRYAQPGLILLLGLTLFFWQNLSNLLPWDLERIVGITIALGAGVVFYFDRRLDRLSPLGCQLTHVSISEGLARAFEHVREPRIIRIFAFSTYVIQPILNDLHVRTRECALLLYNPNHPPDQGEVQPQTLEAQMTLAPMKEWLYMKREGSISELEIKTHKFYPLLYFVLFDDRALLVGHYLVQDHRFPKCEVQEPCLILDETAEGKILIRKHLEVFESLRNSAKAYPLELDIEVSPV